MPGKSHARWFLLPLVCAWFSSVVTTDVHAEPPRGTAWAGFQTGDRVELDVACSGHWEPVTIVKSEPIAGRTDRAYTVLRQAGDEWSFRAPGIVAPCGRGSGALARERAALGALPIGVYGCMYRGQVVPALEFALLTATTYRDYDGGEGTYRSDPTTRVLKFVTGPMRGTLAQQNSATTVRVLDNGIETGNVCAHNPARDMHAPHF
ncbi:MAG: hypothetical protein ABI411_21165 [Tahibacter sp.]